MLRKTMKHLIEKTHKVAVKPHALHEQNKMRTKKSAIDATISALNESNHGDLILRNHIEG